MNVSDDEASVDKQLLMVCRILAVAVAVDQVFEKFPDAEMLDQFLNMGRAQGPK